MHACTISFEHENIFVQPERATDIDKPNRAITTSNCEKMKPDFIPRGDITFFFRLPYFYETYCTTILAAVIQHKAILFLNWVKYFE